MTGADLHTLKAMISVLMSLCFTIFNQCLRGVHGSVHLPKVGTIHVVSAESLNIDWNDNVNNDDITGCHYTYITKGTNLEDEFLGFGNSGRETGRINITSRHAGWDFINDLTPCLGGISKMNSSYYDDGKYRITLVLNDKTEIESNDITVNIYDANVKDYILQIEDASYNRTLMNLTMNTIPAELGDPFDIKISLASDVPSPFITIMKKTNGERQFQVECEATECDVTAYIISKDFNVSINILVNTALRGYEMSSITQPINYKSELCPTEPGKPSTNPTLRAGLVTVLVLFILSILGILGAVIYVRKKQEIPKQIAKMMNLPKGVHTETEEPMVTIQSQVQTPSHPAKA